MAISGIGTYFNLHNAAGAPTNISTYLDTVTPTSEPDDLDGTTFQPGVPAPARVKVPGFRNRTFSLSGKWTAVAETFFSGIEGKVDLLYEYGPDGSGSGKTKITGTCNCLSYSGPISTVDGVTTFTAELAVNTRTLAAYVFEDARRIEEQDDADRKAHEARVMEESRLATAAAESRTAEDPAKRRW